MTTTATPKKTLTLSGEGLMTGLPVSVEVSRAEVGQGIRFVFEDGSEIPARLESVVHTDRGVTLSNIAGSNIAGANAPEKTLPPKTLSIVEHFLCACSMAGLSDLTVKIQGQAPELPILDGGSARWLSGFRKAFGIKAQKLVPDIRLAKGLFYRHNDEICLYALPSTHFQVTYAVDYPHPKLDKKWIRWDSLADSHDEIAVARTYGFLRELPALQARGLAKGVTEENTVGLTDEGGYITELRIEDEPLRHKVLDLIGDLTLMGVNPFRLKAHVYAINAGHESHTAFARKLWSRLASSQL